MQIKVSGRHIEITDPIRDYAESKAEKLPKFFDRVQGIDVVASKQDRTFEVEMVVHVEHAPALVAKASSDVDLYACIDAAADKAERQLTDMKKKLIKSHRQSGEEG